MAGKRITQFPRVTQVAGNELMLMVQNGVTKAGETGLVLTAAETAAETIARDVATEATNAALLNVGTAGIDLVLIYGQSNAMGAGWQGTLTGGAANTLTDYTDPRVMQFALSGEQAGQWIIASEPMALSLGLNDAGDQPAINAMAAGRISPWLAVGKWLAQLRPASRRIGLVNSAVGGSGFTAGPWVAGDPGGNLYEDAITNSIAAWNAAGLNARVVAFAWIQGENDGMMDKATYEANLIAAINGFRERLGDAGLTGVDTAPFVIFGMVPHRNAPTNIFNEWDNQIAQAHRNMPGLLENVVFQEGPDGDATDVHYSAATLRSIAPTWAQVIADAIRLELNSDDTLLPPAPVASRDGTDDASVRLSYEAVTTAARISNVEGRYRLSGNTDWSNTVTFDWDAYPSGYWRPTFTGLTNGQAYEFQIRFTNGAGPGPWSNTVTATVYDLPDVPQNVQATSTGQTSIRVTWEAPSGGGTVTSYEVAWRLSGAARYTTVSVSSSTFLADIINLAPGTPYQFYVRAVGQAGRGYCNTPVTTSTDAIVIPNVSAVAISNTRVGIFFDPPALPFDAFQGYASLAGEDDFMAVTTAPGVSRPAYVSDLTSDTDYDINIAAMADGVPTGETASVTDVTTDNKAYSPLWSMFAPRGAQLDGDNNVAGYYDQWGYASMTQGTSGSRMPQATTVDGMLGVPANSGKFLQNSGNVPTTGDFTVVCLWNFPSVTNVSAWFVCPQFSGVTGRWWLWRSTANSGRLTLGWPSAGVVVAGTSPFVVGWNLFAWTFRRSDAYCELFLNGAAIGTGTFPITTIGGPTEFNANGGTASTINNGYIGGIELVQTRLSLAQLQAEETRLETKYSITIG